MWLDAVVAFEPGMQHQRGMGIRAEIDAPGLADEERVFHIDVHEIEELVRAIGYMTSPPEGEEPVRGNDRTEMSITTRDGLEVGTLVTAAGTGSFLRTASASFEIRGAGLQTLHATLDKARGDLDLIETLRSQLEAAPDLLPRLKTQLEKEPEPLPDPPPPAPSGFDRRVAARG